jgi:hypothetical protein
MQRSRRGLAGGRPAPACDPPYWCIAASCVAHFSVAEIFSYGVQKSLGLRRRRHVAAENCVEVMGSAVELIGVLGILADRCSIQVDACKDPRLRDQVSISARMLMSVEACASRPTGPAAADASAPILNLSCSKSWKPL